MTTEGGITQEEDKAGTARTALTKGAILTKESSGADAAKITTIARELAVGAETEAKIAAPWTLKILTGKTGTQKKDGMRENGLEGSPGLTQPSV